MLPEISKLQFETDEVIIEEQINQTFKWNFETEDFETIDGRLIEIDKIDYIKTWIEKILRTRKDLEIYTKYGSEHHDLIGTVYERDFVQAEITRMVREALLRNEAIREIGKVTVESDGAELIINFGVKTIYGNTEVSVWKRSVN